MALISLVRRRRFATLKCTLIGLTVMSVLFWFNQVRNSTTSIEIADDSSYQLSTSFKVRKNSLPISSDLRDRLKLESVSIFHNFKSKNKSAFNNPVLLNKLRKKSLNFQKNYKNVTVKHEIKAVNNIPISSTPNFKIPTLEIRPGLGERGVPVILSASEQKLADKLFNKAAFNVYLSDRISLNRSVPDPRNPKCEYESYDHYLPTASVIIIFTNEIWSALLRTIYSVINRSPSHLLHEIILVDDYSDNDELKYYLKKYIQQHFSSNLVKLIRLPNRQGLIRARLSGAKLATGDVLVFLDSHCEANTKWLEPLLQRIKEERTAVLCPIIDVIDDKTFEYYASNQEYFQIGGFTWNGHFTWIEIPESEEKRRNSEIAPTRTPTMAGGLFAIDRKYFFEIGSYDSGMDIWGGENLELSFRVWMCGGLLEIVPCSHVGHIFRNFHPYTFPGNKDSHGINTVRTVEVWMEDYKRYFYMYRPDLKSIQYGDISERLNLKKKLKCKSFKWYLETVYPGKFLYDKDVTAYGKVKNPVTNLCLDTLNKDEDKSEPLGFFSCNQKKGIVMNQLLSFTNQGELRKEDNCAQVDEDDAKSELTVVMGKCHDKKENQEWKHEMGGPLLHMETGKCLTVRHDMAEDNAFVADCHGGHTQIWWFENYVGLKLNTR